MWLLAAGFLVLGVALVGVAVGAVLVARHRAQAAADLGALAGAPYTIEGATTACPRAEQIVIANGGRLVGCRIEGLDLIITAETAAGVLPGGPSVRAYARAGPVGPVMPPVMPPGRSAARGSPDGPGPRDGHSTGYTVIVRSADRRGDRSRCRPFDNRPRDPAANPAYCRGSRFGLTTAASSRSCTGPTTS